MVGAAVPCRPPRQPDREAGSLKTCSPVFVSGTRGAQGVALVEPFVAPRSFFSTISTFSTANIVRAAGDCRPYRWTTHGPPLYIFYILYTVKFIARRDTQSHAEKSPILHSLHFLHG